MKQLTSLTVKNKTIEDLSGLEFAINLNDLNLSSNNITDVSPLANLTNLTRLNLDGNNISDISALGNLSNLKKLILSNNQISNVNVLAAFQHSIELDLSYNYLTKLPVEIENRLPVSQIEGNFIEGQNSQYSFHFPELSNWSIDVGLGDTTNLTQNWKMGLFDDLSGITTNFPSHVKTPTTLTYNENNLHVEESKSAGYPSALSITGLTPGRHQVVYEIVPGYSRTITVNVAADATDYIAPDAPVIHDILDTDTTIKGIAEPGSIVRITYPTDKVYTTTADPITGEYVVTLDNPNTIPVKTVVTAIA
ncbi:leucine-rich repeat domain-containing protein, partial [Bacillus velezensis]|uniref:leucine-rich repeat domain-containing protein n=1 Tax=Bacillus velezensis TaxID=492670 RepID=UPI002FFE9F1B